MRDTTRLFLCLVLAMLSVNTEAGILDRLGVAIFGGRLELDKLEKQLYGMEFAWLSYKDAASCSADLSNFDQQIEEIRRWRRIVTEDQAAGITAWHTKDQATSQKVKDLKAAKPNLSKDQKSLIERCAKERGFGLDVMLLQGAINWTNDRINEYRVYLPRLWCDEEVYNWMAANNAEAQKVLPKLEAALESGIVYYFEFSPMTRPMYLEYKNLEAMHQDVYDDEGHVFRSAADHCASMDPPPQIITRDEMDLSTEDLRAAINALDEVKWAHETDWYKRLSNAAKSANDPSK